MAWARYHVGMTVRAKLFASLSGLGLSIALLAGVALWSMNTDAAAIETITAARVAPLRELKIVADRYAVEIVDAAHKARNGNLSLAEAAARVRNGSAALRQGWAAYRRTSIDGEEARLAQEAEARMRVADAKVAALQAILDHRDRPALHRFVRRDLYQSIDPVSDALGRLVDLQLTRAVRSRRRRSTSSRARSSPRSGGWRRRCRRW